MVSEDPRGEILYALKLIIDKIPNTFKLSTIDQFNEELDLVCSGYEDLIKEDEEIDALIDMIFENMAIQEIRINKIDTFMNSQLKSEEDEE